MFQEKKKLLLKYLVCLGVAALMTVAVFAIDGFFTDDIAVNIQILSDGFSVRIKWRAAVSSLSAVIKQLKDKRGKIKGKKALLRSFPFPFAL